MFFVCFGKCLQQQYCCYEHFPKNKKNKFNIAYATLKKATNRLSSELLSSFEKTRVADKIIFIAQAFSVNFICKV